MVMAEIELMKEFNASTRWMLDRLKSNPARGNPATSDKAVRSDWYNTIEGICTLYNMKLVNLEFVDRFFGQGFLEIYNDWLTKKDLKNLKDKTKYCEWKKYLKGYKRRTRTKKSR